MTETELPMKHVVCRTPGCENDGITITLPCGDAVYCGPCGQPITDITEASS